MKPKILFVDDEPNVLDGLRCSLRAMRLTWDMSFAPGGREALELLAVAPHDVVVADMIMPGLDGVALLQEVRQRYPRCGRILLSGYCGADSAQCMGRLAQRQLLKPCPTAELIEAVDRVLALRAMCRLAPTRD